VESKKPVLERNEEKYQQVVSSQEEQKSAISLRETIFKFNCIFLPRLLLKKPQNGSLRQMTIYGKKRLGIRNFECVFMSVLESVFISWRVRERDRL
jgi:hypothetical protein